RDARDAGAQAAVYAGPKRDRVAVRADRDEVAGRDPALPGVGGRELELRLRPLELELRDALDGGAGEKRLVRDEPDLSALGLLLRLRQRLAHDVLLRLGIEAQRRPLSDLAERQPAVNALRDLGEDRRGIRRHVDVEPRGELRDPLQLVGTGRLDRAAQPLQAALEIDEGAVALEIGRARQDQVGPAGGEPAEHRDHDRRLGLLGERTDVVVRRGLVARHDEQPDRIRRFGLLVAACGPGVGNSAAVRRLGQVEGAAALTAREPELLRELRDRRAAAAARPAPDEDDALRLGDGRVVRVVEDPGAVATG